MVVAQCGAWLSVQALDKCQLLELWASFCEWGMLPLEHYH